MGAVLLFALTASGALVLGAALGVRWRPRPALLAALLAFASGALTAALAFELFEESFSQGGGLRSALGLLAGASVFIAIDTWLDRRVESTGADATGFSLLAGVTLDGVPENLALGTTLAAGGGSIALLAAIVASNLPEALVGARSMVDDGRSGRFAILTWTGAGVLLALAVVAGASLLDGAGEGVLSVTLAFAGGAVLASLAATVYPKAYEEGGPWIGFATAAGFLVLPARDGLTGSQTGALGIRRACRHHEPGG